MNDDNSDLPCVEKSKPAAKPATAKPRRRWWRFFYQFSLRTMLIATTLAAIGCWWFLRPDVKDEQLAGRYLSLKRQVRLARDSTGQTVDDIGMENVGSWQLRGEHGDLLVSGHYVNNEQTGRWTTWHTNGRRAVEGQVVRGARNGLWEVWDEAGTLRSEVTYRAAKRIEPTNRGLGTPLIPVVGAIGPLAQLGGGWVPPPPPLPSTTFVAQRHGPCRVWYASGKLHYEGNYRDDRRDGLWTWYDEQGNVIEQGSCKADLREGQWRQPSSAAGTKLGPGAPEATSMRSSPGPGLVPAKNNVVYVAGRTQAEHEQLLARLENQFASGNLRRQVAAATALEESGPAGQPILGKLLTDPSDEVRLLALRALVRQGPLDAKLLSSIEPLAVHPDERLSLRALVAIYQLQPARREALFPRIMEKTRAIHQEGLAVETLQRICKVDPDRRPMALLRLIELMAQNAAPADGYDRRRAYDYPLFVPEHLRPVLAIEGDLLPVLEEAFGSTDPQVRLYVIQCVETLIEAGSPTQLPSGEMTYEIPPAAKPLVERAKADADPAVRTQAEQIGKPPVAVGQGGGFF